MVSAQRLELSCGRIHKASEASNLQIARLLQRSLGSARQELSLRRSNRRIKSQDGPDLIVSGSSTLTSTLLEHGLADEVVLAVYPVLLGTGKRFFAEATPARSFELVSTQAMPSGIIFSTYKVAGPLKKG